MDAMDDQPFPGSYVAMACVVYVRTRVRCGGRVVSVAAAVVRGPPFSLSWVTYRTLWNFTSLTDRFLLEFLPLQDYYHQKYLSVLCMAQDTTED